MCQCEGFYWSPGTEGAGGFCDRPQSPIIIDLDKNAKYELSSLVNGVSFDLNGDGLLENLSWTIPGSGVAFLAVDRNGDGKINNGTELFGNYTYSGVSNGFLALEKMALESNGGVMSPGAVTSDDPLFARLLLWHDANHNGISEPEELRRASEVLSAVGIGYDVRKKIDEHGNVFKYRGWVHIRTKPGKNKSESGKDSQARTRHIWDVYLVKR